MEEKKRKKIIEVIERHPDFKKYELRTGPALQIPGLEIYPDRRKIFRDRREISLTAKEFAILCFLAANPMFPFPYTVREQRRLLF